MAPQAPTSLRRYLLTYSIPGIEDPPVVPGIDWLTGRGKTFDEITSRVLRGHLQVWHVERSTTPGYGLAVLFRVGCVLHTAATYIASHKVRGTGLSQTIWPLFCEEVVRHPHPTARTTLLTSNHVIGSRLGLGERVRVAGAGLVNIRSDVYRHDDRTRPERQSVAASVRSGYTTERRAGGYGWSAGHSWRT